MNGKLQDHFAAHYQAAGGPLKTRTGYRHRQRDKIASIYLIHFHKVFKNFPRAYQLMVAVATSIMNSRKHWHGIRAAQQRMPQLIWVMLELMCVLIL